MPDHPETLAAIGLGSNLGDSPAILLQSWDWLGCQPGIRTVALSAPYRSEPVGMISEHWFTNAAGLLATTLPPEQTLEILLATETRFGRRRTPGAGYQDRTLDLDLLLYGDLVLTTTRLCLPHPRMHERLFVLAPLAELAPDWLHPELGISIARLAARAAEDGRGQSGLERWTWPRQGVDFFPSGREIN